MIKEFMQAKRVTYIPGAVCKRGSYCHWVRDGIERCAHKWKLWKVPRSDKVLVWAYCDSEEDFVYRLIE